MALSTFHSALSVRRLMASPLDKQCSKHVGNCPERAKVTTERRGAQRGADGRSTQLTRSRPLPLAAGAGERMCGLLPPSSSEDTPGGVSTWHRQESSLHLPSSIISGDTWGPCSLVRLAVCLPTKVPLMSSVRTRLQQQEHASRHLPQQNVLRAS